MRLHRSSRPTGGGLGYWAAGQIRKVPLDGGPQRAVAALDMFGASWGDDDRIVFARSSGGLLEVPPPAARRAMTS